MWTLVHWPTFYYNLINMIDVKINHNLLKILSSLHMSWCMIFTVLCTTWQLNKIYCLSQYYYLYLHHLSLLFCGWCTLWSVESLHHGTRGTGHWRMDTPIKAAGFVFYRCICMQKRTSSASIILYSRDAYSCLYMYEHTY